ncbi:MAG: hypothetical protein GY757_43200 [bacterium]|nr:hypothetical protein [bacterium]
MKDFVCISELKKKQRLIEELTKNGQETVKGGAFYYTDPDMNDYGLVEDDGRPGGC